MLLLPDHIHLSYHIIFIISWRHRVFQGKIWEQLGSVDHAPLRSLERLGVRLYREPIFLIDHDSPAFCLGWKFYRDIVENTKIIQFLWSYEITKIAKLESRNSTIGEHIYMHFLKKWRLLLGGEASNIFGILTPDPWGNDPIWRAYFSDGLVQPPTNLFWKLMIARLDSHGWWGDSIIHYGLMERQWKKLVEELYNFGFWNRTSPVTCRK